MPRNPYDPRFERKVTEVRSRVIKGKVLTAASDWGAAGWEQQQPRMMEADEERAPVEHPYRRHPRTGDVSQAPPVLRSRGGDKSINGS